MAFKLIIIPALFAMANAGALLTTHYSAPVASLAYAPAVAKVATPILAKHVEEPYNANPQYSYSYDVQDSLTGDNKQQHESRNGDVVEGSYSFIEADGSRRIVEYTADALNGFNAVVRKEPATAAAPLAYAAPAPATVYAKAPLAYTHQAPAIAYAAQPVAKLVNTIQH